MLNLLKQQQLKKNSKNLTLEKVKETFQETDFNDSKKKVNADQEMEIDEDDSEYKEEEEMIEDHQIWDDEENVVQKSQD